MRAAGLTTSFLLIFLVGLPIASFLSSFGHMGTPVMIAWYAVFGFWTRIAMADAGRNARIFLVLFFLSPFILGALVGAYLHLANFPQ